MNTVECCHCGKRFATYSISTTTHFNKCTMIQNKNPIGPSIFALEREKSFVSIAMIHYARYVNNSMFSKSQYGGPTLHIYEFITAGHLIWV